MNNQSNTGSRLMDWFVVIAALMLYWKTADVLSYFSPQNLNDILGFNVALLYGNVSALLVEGLALTLHFNKRARLSSGAQVVKWIALAISGACQVFDGFIVTESLAQMSDTMRAVLAYGVPLIPLLIVIMIFGIGHLPELGEEKPAFKGLKNMLPSPKRLWHGDAPPANKNKPVNPTKGKE